MARSDEVSVAEAKVEHSEVLHSRIAVIEVENYRGLTVSTVLVLLSLCLISAAQLLSLVGAGAYARDIAATVGGSTETTWLAQSIAILTCVLGLPVCQAADFWGRKWFLVLATLCGAIGSVIMSRASSMGMAIAGQVIAGGVFSVQALTNAVASEILPRRWRPVAQGTVYVWVGIGGLTAILSGSAFVKYYSEGWRLFWYMVTAVLAFSSLICAIFYNPAPRDLQLSLTLREKLRRLDWVGFALLTTGVVLFCIGLSWALNPYSWKDPHVLAPLIVGIVLMIALGIYEIWFEKEGIFHHDLFKKDRNFALALGCIFMEGTAFFAVNQYFAFEVSVLYETDPIIIGLEFGMLFLVGITSSVLITLYSSRFKKVREPIVLFFVLSLIAFVGLATNNLSSSKSSWVYISLLGFGSGAGLPCLITTAQMSAPPDLIAISSGLLISMRSLGGSIGLAIFSAIFSSATSKHIGPGIAAAVLPLGLSPTVLPQFITALNANDMKALMSIPGINPEIIHAGGHALQSAYVIAFRDVWICAAALMFVTLIASFFVINPKKEFTMHVDAPLEKDENVANES